MGDMLQPVVTPEVWHGVPEVVCTGSPYEVGVCHGTQARERIAVCLANYQRLFLETANADWTESKRRAAQFLPSLTKSVPDLVSEMQGIAAGAGLEFEDILALNLRSEIALTNYTDGCTAIAKADVGTSTVLLAENWDWVGEAANSILFMDIRGTGKPRIRILGEAGLVGKNGFNEHGLGICMNAIRSSALDISKLPVHVAIRTALECKSYKDAVEWLDTRGLASCVNFMVADKAGSIATIECSPKGNSIIAPVPGSGTVCHTNHLYAPNLPPGLKDHPSNNSISRLNRIRELSAGVPGSVERFREWLSDEKGTPYSICRSTPENAVGLDRAETLATIIMDLQNLDAQITLGRPSLNPPIRTISIR